MNKKIPIILGLVIIAVSAVVLMGGVFAYQYWWAPRGENQSTEAKLTSFGISPSCEYDNRTILYPAGAKAIAKGENLDKVEFWGIPAGTGLEDFLYEESPIIKNGDQWEAVLPSDMGAIDFYAVGYDSNGNKVGKIAIGKNISGPDSSGGSPNAAKYPKDCKKDETADWKTYGNEEYEVKYPQDILATEINNNLVLRDYTPSYEDRNVPQREMNINKLEQEADCQDTTLLSFKDSEKIGDITFKHYVNYPEHLGAYCGMSTGCQYHDIYRSSYKGNCYEINIRRNDVAYRNDNQTFSEVFNQILSTFKFLE